jgi:hypothetical protein
MVSVRIELRALQLSSRRIQGISTTSGSWVFASRQSALLVKGVTFGVGSIFRSLCRVRVGLPGLVGQLLRVIFESTGSDGWEYLCFHLSHLHPPCDSHVPRARVDLSVSRVEGDGGTVDFQIFIDQIACRQPVHHSGPTCIGILIYLFDSHSRGCTKSAESSRGVETIHDVQ